MTGAQPIPGAAPQSDKTNGLAIAGLVLAFIIPLIGFVLSIVGLNQINKRGEKGKGLAIAGIVVSSIFMLISVFILLSAFMAVPKLQEKARDTEAKTDINYLHSSLEAFYNENTYYPSSLNELQVTDREALKPSSPTGSYDYKPGPSGCTKCQTYTLSTKLEDGTSYSKNSLY